MLFFRRCVLMDIFNAVYFIVLLNPKASLQTFALSAKTETSSAGEQLVRGKADVRRKCHFQGATPRSSLIFLENFMPLKTHR